MGVLFCHSNTADVNAFVETNKNETVETEKEIELIVPLGNYLITRGMVETHLGLDFAAQKGEFVMAVENGVVSYAGDAALLEDESLSGYGLIVVIEPGNKLKSLYAHNSKVLVTEGAVVEKGQAIAEVGSTGNSTGNHVHFEVRQNDQPVQIEFSDKGESPIIKGKVMSY